MTTVGMYAECLGCRSGTHYPGESRRNNMCEVPAARSPRPSSASSVAREWSARWCCGRPAMPRSPWRGPRSPRHAGPRKGRWGIRPLWCSPATWAFSGALCGRPNGATKGGSEASVWIAKVDTVVSSESWMALTGTAGRPGTRNGSSTSPSGRGNPRRPAAHAGRRARAAAGPGAIRAEDLLTATAGGHWPARQLRALLCYTATFLEGLTYPDRLHRPRGWRRMRSPHPRSIALTGCDQAPPDAPASGGPTGGRPPSTPSTLLSTVASARDESNSRERS